MSVFIDQRLPVEIEAGAKARPRYNTDVITTDGGWEVRNSRWAYPLFQFEFNVEPGTRVDNQYDVLDEFLDIFHVCGGSAGGFRFHHWRDKPVVGQYIATGDGSTKTFQLFRTYSRGGFSRDRKITRPVLDTVIIYSNGVAVSAGVDYDTGLVTTVAAPVLNAIVTSDFEHDVPVRFADDELEMVGLTDDLDQPVSIVLMEFRE